MRWGPKLQDREWPEVAFKLIILAVKKENVCVVGMPSSRCSLISLVRIGPSAQTIV